MKHGADANYNMIDFEDDDKPIYNVDGTPMLNDLIDIRGNLYGCTTSSLSEDLANSSDSEDYSFDSFENDSFIDTCAISDSFSFDTSSCCSYSIIDSFSSDNSLSSFDSMSGVGIDSFSLSSFDW